MTYIGKGDCGHIPQTTSLCPKGKTEACSRDKEGDQSPHCSLSGVSLPLNSDLDGEGTEVCISFTWGWGCKGALGLHLSALTLTVPRCLRKGRLAGACY